MMYLGDKAVGINQRDILARGIFISNTDITTTTIDTGVTGWKHFLFVIKSMPAADKVRILASRYVYADTNNGYCIYVMASSAGTSSGYPNNCTCYKFDPNMINGSTITISGIGSTIGTIYANTEYEWYCW